MPQTEIRPFDCRQGTCECDPSVKGVVSENYLVRFDGRKAGSAPDKQRTIFRCTRGGGAGEAVVHRDSVEVCRLPVTCQTGWQCVATIDAAQVPRVPIRMDDGTGAMTLAQAFTQFQAWGAPANPIPEIRPYTDRERFEVAIRCGEDDASAASLAVTGWDCDLILLAYQLNYVAAMSTAGALTGIQTVQQFFAAMAIRGVHALCELYFSSATSCQRAFKDPNSAIGISALMAEETLKAVVGHLRSLPLSPAWTDYFAEPNLTMAQLDLTAFRHYGDLYAAAHLKEGLKRALSMLPPSPCRAEDLDTVVETLLRAQEPTLTSAVGAIPMSMAGTSVADEFRGRMRQQMIEALDETGDSATAGNLRQRWGMP